MTDRYQVQPDNLDAVKQAAQEHRPTPSTNTRAAFNLPFKGRIQYDGKPSDGALLKHSHGEAVTTNLKHVTHAEASNSNLVTVSGIQMTQQEAVQHGLLGGAQNEASPPSVNEDALITIGKTEMKAADAIKMGLVEVKGDQLVAKDPDLINTIKAQEQQEAAEQQKAAEEQKIAEERQAIYDASDAALDKLEAEHGAEWMSETVENYLEKGELPDAVPDEVINGYFEMSAQIAEGTGLVDTDYMQLVLSRQELLDAQRAVITGDRNQFEQHCNRAVSSFNNLGDEDWFKEIVADAGASLTKQGSINYIHFNHDGQQHSMPLSQAFKEGRFTFHY